MKHGIEWWFWNWEASNLARTTVTVLKWWVWTAKWLQIRWAGKLLSVACSINATANQAKPRSNLFQQNTTGDAFLLQKHETLDTKVGTISEDAFQRVASADADAGADADAYFLRRLSLKNQLEKYEDKFPTVAWHDAVCWNRCGVAVDYFLPCVAVNQGSERGCERAMIAN